MTGSAVTPPWLLELVDSPSADDGVEVRANGHGFVWRNGILREQAGPSEPNSQMAEAFGFKWSRWDTYESDLALASRREWLLERYGEVANASWWDDYSTVPLLLDAGCGAAMSAMELFGDRLKQVRYLGADVSDAVDVAAVRLGDRGVEGGFIQGDLTALPLPDASVDVIFSEGVLHYVDPPGRAVSALARLLKPGGRFLFYVYRKKGPIREFTDEYIREELNGMTPEDAWDAVMPLSRLGKALGDLDMTVEVPEDVEILGIPAGSIDLQRLFYWHVFKAFYRPEMTVEEMNLINFDWYGPSHAYHQTPDEVRAGCLDAGLEIERELAEQAGITIVARATV